VTTPIEAARDELLARIERAGGDPAAIRIVAVTKGQDVAVVRAVAEAGLHELGESYAQELLTKVEEAPASVRWHFIGRLQRNKVRLIAPFTDLWQSIDRLPLAAEVARHAPGAAVLVQVNVSGQDQQGGCAPARVGALVEGCRDLGLDVRGLMAIGPRGDDHHVRAAFRRVRELADQQGLPERSMGMSDDLELAVAEGTTMLRVGTALVGPRGGPPAVGT
jgi:pyridoxal phosphate enzyme (YggS family)